MDFAINISQVFGIQIVCFCLSTISIRIATAKNKSSSNIYKSADWHIRHTIYVTHDINMCVHCAKRHLFTRFPFVWRAMTERKTFNFTIVYTWNELQANFVCFTERKQNKYQPLVGFEIICISFLFKHYKKENLKIIIISFEKKNLMRNWRNSCRTNFNRFYFFAVEEFFGYQAKHHNEIWKAQCHKKQTINDVAKCAPHFWFILFRSFFVCLRFHQINVIFSWTIFWSIQTILRKLTFISFRKINEWIW